ncbi:hypothetical protein BZA77DRAFT_351852 [Pyronema omphalodes]|nr:hypothetical protein BZA77DRAFT_351852 [Pyronema omphalodes]
MERDRGETDLSICKGVGAATWAESAMARDQQSVRIQRPGEEDQAVHHLACLAQFNPLPIYRAQYSPANHPTQYPRSHDALFVWMKAVVGTTTITGLFLCAKAWDWFPQLYRSVDMPKCSNGWLEAWKKHFHVQQYVRHGEASSASIAEAEENMQEISDDDVSSSESSPTPPSRTSSTAVPNTDQNKKTLPEATCTPDPIIMNDPQYTVQQTVGKNKKCPATSSAHTITHIAANPTPVPAGVQRLRRDTDDTLSTPPFTGNPAISIDQLSDNLTTATDMF